MKVFFAALIILAVFVLSVLFMGWMLMLLVGALYTSFGWLSPIGFWPSTGIALLVNILLTPFKIRAIK